MIDAHPALKAVSPQAPDRRLVHRRRLPPQRRVLPAARLQLLSPLRPAAARADARSARRPLRLRHARRLRVLPRRSARSRTSTRSYFKGEIAFWNDDDASTRPTTSSGRRATCGRTCKNITPAVMTVGGWFDAEDLFGPLETYRAVEKQSPASRTCSSWARGRTAAGRAATATCSATCASTPKTAHFYREKIELPFFEHHLKGTARPERPPRRTSSRPGATSGRATTRGRRRTPTPRTLYFHADGAPVVRRRRREADAASTSTSAIPPSRCRTSTRSSIGMITRVHDRRPALRRAPARRAGLPDRAARGGPDARRAARRRRCTSRPPAPTPTGS